ncbi:MAG: hypothetical protein AB1543_06230, partial [Candidatus Bipolaricaulota bacterium]
WFQATLINAGRENSTAREVIIGAATFWEQVGRPVAQVGGEFFTGMVYQAVKSNLEPVGSLSMGLNPQVRQELPDRVREFESGFPETTAFRLGRILGGMIGLAESVAVAEHGGTLITGGIVACGTGVLCEAGAPAMALGVVEFAAAAAMATASLRGTAEQVVALSRPPRGVPTAEPSVARPPIDPDHYDPTQPPGEGWEWHGRGEPGGNKGAWVNEQTR